jgi:two-component system, NarL family, sensor kinase
MTSACPTRSRRWCSRSSVLNLLALPLMPVAVATAIVKYRLYDIDRILNRTLVYGTLTAILGLGCAGLVLSPRR